MKKIFAMLLILCMPLSLTALAESADAGLIDPFNEDQPGLEETALETEAEAEADTEDETEAEAVEAAPAAQPATVVAGKPDGETLYLNEFNGDYDAYLQVMLPGGAFVVDELKARDAAEDSMVIPADPGCKIVDVRVVFNMMGSNRWIGAPNAFGAKLFAGDQELPCRKFIESEEKNDAAHYTCDSKDADHSKCTLGYLINPEGLKDSIGNDGDTDTHYYLFDVFAEVPEETLSSGQPFYIQLTVGEKVFCCRVL